MPPRRRPYLPPASNFPRIESVFMKLEHLTDRVTRNGWNDRVAGRFSTTSRIDEDYEPVDEGQ